MAPLKPIITCIRDGETTTQGAQCGTSTVTGLSGQRMSMVVFRSRAHGLQAHDLPIIRSRACRQLKGGHGRGVVHLYLQARKWVQQGRRGHRDLMLRVQGGLLQCEKRAAEGSGTGCEVRRGCRMQ